MAAEAEAAREARAKVGYCFVVTKNEGVFSSGYSSWGGTEGIQSLEGSFTGHIRESGGTTGEEKEGGVELILEYSKA